MPVQLLTQSKRFVYLIFINQCFIKLSMAALLFITASSIYAQKAPYTFELIPLQSGEVRLTITSIIQDSQGFIWIGTNMGLYKHDGYKFTPYFHDPNNPGSLSDAFIRSLYEDHAGFIWVGTNSGGLNRLDKATETFVQYIPEMGNPGVQGHGSVWAIHQDSIGSLWVGTRGGLYKLNISTDKINYYDINPELRTPFVRSISQDDHGNLWVGSSEGLCIMTFNSDSSYNYKYYRHRESDINSLSSNTVRSLLIDSSNSIWVGTSDGLNYLDIKTDSIRRFTAKDNATELSHQSISNMWLDKSGVLWIGTAGGGINQLIRADDGEVRINHYYTDPQNPGSIQSNNIWTIFRDKSGLIWAGTDLGLYKLITASEKVLTYKNLPELAGSLSNNTVMSMFVDTKKRLWVGTEKGLNRLDPIPDRQAIPNFIKYTHDPNASNSLSDDQVTVIYQSKPGPLWIGTKAGGVNLFDPETGKSEVFRKRPGDPNSLSSNGIRCILEHPVGVLWVGTRMGLNKINLEDRSVTTFVNDPGDTQSLSDNVVLCLYVDKSNQLWIGTRNGLNNFNFESEKFKSYGSSPNPSLNPINMQILCIEEDDAGTLWLGTPKGLTKLEKTSGKIVFQSVNIVPGAEIKNILEDDDHNLWLNSDQGILKYNPKSGLVKNYLSGETLKNRNQRFGAFYKSEDGEFFVGGGNGLRRFYAHSLKDNSNIPPVVITDFQLFNSSVPINDTTRNKPILNQHISLTESIELTYRESIFSFEFAALDYFDPERNQFMYKMEGFHDDWINTESDKRFATFTNLDPGNYTFRVIASNNDDLWNEEGASILVTIKPPPWSSWWAYIIYVALCIGLVFVYFKYQRRQLKLKQVALKREKLHNERLQRADKLKDEFLANTSHELRTPLNGIIGIAESLFDEVDDKYDNIKSDLSLLISSGKRLSSLVNSILDFSKLKTHDLQLTKVPLDLHSMVNVVIRLSTPLIEGKDLVFANRVPVDAPAIFADENRIMQILNNLISNAIKFTETGTISISAREENGYMAISVTDTGIGIASDKIDTVFKEFEQIDSSITRKYVGTGLGLSISKKLIELHGGQITVHSEPGKGATFTFTMPISRDKPDEFKKTSEISRVQLHSQPDEFDYDAVHSNHEIRILVVDDETINQKVLINHLSKAKYDVTTAFNGEEALIALDHMGKFDLVLLDVMMPKMSGFEVCQKIRERFSSAELPVIIITAKNQVTDLVEGFSSGANDYIVKPFSKDEFISRVKTHLELHKINSAYNRFIPIEFLKSIGRESILDVQLGDQIQQEITVLFCDIRSYSTLSESMTPKENFNFLNAFLKRVAPLIKQHNGFINQFLGDGVMALFLKSTGDSIRSSIAIQKELHNYNQDRIRENRLPIEAGIGLHNGPLMMGIIGHEDRMDPGVVSDTVNTAARMEGLTKYYGASIILSESTLQKVPNPSIFNYRALGIVQVKGKNQALKIYEVFDGDKENLFELKLKTKDDFEEGLNNFLIKNFTEAASAFKKVLHIHPQDKAALLYMERSAEYMVKGVPDRWVGIETVSEK